jgi:arylformamidase
MFIYLDYNGKQIEINLLKPIDISLNLIPGKQGVNCFYSPLFEAEPVRAGTFVGATSEGGPVNFMNVKINPHGNGTHTECVGHISKEKVSINDVLKEFHFVSKLISVYPEVVENGDKVIKLNNIEELFKPDEADVVIIRTLPNHIDKRQRNYSGTNPPYIESAALSYFIKCGVKHFLIDLPSVDKEEDEGKLLGHKAFWEYPKTLNQNRTITELVYIPNEVEDGYYFLNLQIASFGIDVSPSKPVLYRMKEK